MALSSTSPTTTTTTTTSTTPEQPSQGLTPSQIAFWDTNGYLIIEDALPPSTVAALLAETRQMLNDFSLDDHPMTRFSTGEGEGKHVGDEYFLESGDKVRFFFEEAAFDPTTSRLTKPKPHAINKIGHNLHGLSPRFRAATLSAQNRGLARSLRLRDPRVLQSMIICKQPEIGAAVPPHQDSTFLYTDPPSAVGFWYALEDATASNGCLSFLPGSHKLTPITKRFIRQRDSPGTDFEPVTGAQFPPDLDPAHQSNGHPNGNSNGHSNGHTNGHTNDSNGTVGKSEEEEEYTLRGTKAGTLVLIHGNLLHKSERNTSAKSRFIYTFHVIEGGEGHVYDEWNWLQPTRREVGFERLYGSA